MGNLNEQQFGTMPARQLRESYRPEPHELYSENTGKPWFHEDDAENLRQHREYKLSEAQRLRYEDEPPGPDNKTLVEHIRDRGFEHGPVLLDSRWKTIVDGNHHLEAAHHLDPDYPVPYKAVR
jgi:hypothetical protein